MLKFSRRKQSSTQNEMTGDKEKYCVNEAGGSKGNNVGGNVLFSSINAKLIRFRYVN